MFKKGCLGCLGVIVVVLVLGGLIAAFGGGGKNSANTSSSSSSSSSAPKEKKDGITYDKFVALPMGASYEDIVAAVGKDGSLDAQNQVGDIETKNYTWQDGTAHLTCMFQNGKMINKAMASLTDLVKPNGETITAEQFGKVNPGMSYDEVKGILGRDGFLLSEGAMAGVSTKIYVWLNNGGSNMNVTIQGGTVQGKTQVGLK